VLPVAANEPDQKIASISRTNLKLSEKHWYKYRLLNIQGVEYVILPSKYFYIKPLDLTCFFTFFNKEITATAYAFSA